MKHIVFEVASLFSYYFVRLQEQINWVSGLIDTTKLSDQIIYKQQGTALLLLILCYYYVSNDTDEIYLVETRASTCDIP